jgi:hypothetical protein
MYMYILSGRGYYKTLLMCYLQDWYTLIRKNEIATIFYIDKKQLKYFQYTQGIISLPAEYAC